MMARHLGARVFPHPHGHAEVGYYPIRPTAAGRARLRRLARPRLSMAPRGLRPAGRRRTAGARAMPFPVQAFRYGSAATRCSSIPK